MNTWPWSMQSLPLELTTLPPVCSKVCARHQIVLSNHGKVTCASTNGQIKIGSIKVHQDELLSPSKIVGDMNSVFASKQTKTFNSPSVCWRYRSYLGSTSVRALEDKCNLKGSGHLLIFSDGLRETRTVHHTKINDRTCC